MAEVACFNPSEISSTQVTSTWKLQKVRLKNMMLRRRDASLEKKLSKALVNDVNSSALNLLISSSFSALFRVFIWN